MHWSCEKEQLYPLRIQANPGLYQAWFLHSFTLIDLPQIKLWHSPYTKRSPRDLENDEEGFSPPRRRRRANRERARVFMLAFATMLGEERNRS